MAIHISDALSSCRDQCYCGDNRLNPEDKRPEIECGSLCKGNKTFICGGSWRNSVYNTSNYGKSEFKYIMLFNCIFGEIR